MDATLLRMTGRIIGRMTGRIVDAEFVTREMPLRRPLRGARGPVATRTIRLLRLKSDDGVAGSGEASAVDWLAPAAASGGDALLVQLAAQIRSDAPAAQALLRWSIDHARPAPLRAALQTALLDAHARRHATSVAAMLGAAQPCPAIALSALVADDEPEAMAREAARYRALGLDCFKVKVGRPRLEDDVARACAVRDAIGPDARLRLDANAAWSVPEARRALDALAAVRPEFVEEPLRDATQTSSLHSPLRVALDESVRSAADLDDALARGGIDVLVLKLERVGGPLPALSLADSAMRAGIEVVWTDSIESEVGRAATLHVAAAAAGRGGTTAGAVGLGGLFLLDGGGGVRPVMPIEGPGIGVDAGPGWRTRQP